VLITRGGSGITQGIGVGGRDVKSPVGGMMTLFSMKALEADESTDVITIVSKPPSPDVQEKIVDFIKDKGRKKYVTCFIGGQEFAIPTELKGRLVQTTTLHAASLESIRLVSDSLYEKALEKISLPPEEVAKIVEEELSKLREGQKYVRGLFTGGTLLYESQVIFKEFIGDVWSNTPLNKDFTLPDAWVSKEHSVVDLGEEEFTAGRAHPMIDPTIRLQRIVQEAKDPETAVIMLDFVLGYGSHPDPAEAHLNAIKKAKEIASENGRHLTILAHVVGTERDPQNALEQEKKLRDVGVILLPTNALMALVAGMIAKGDSSETTARNFFEKYLIGKR
jgi:FdrA protein